MRAAFTLSITSFSCLHLLKPKAFLSFAGSSLQRVICTDAVSALQWHWGEVTRKACLGLSHTATRSPSCSSWHLTFLPAGKLKGQRSLCQTNAGHVFPWMVGAGKQHRCKASHQMEGYPEGPLGKDFISSLEVPDVRPAFMNHCTC